SCPAMICCGGRLDLHGAPLNRTWVKLGADPKNGDKTVTVAEAVSGWRVGDHVIATGPIGPGEVRNTRRPGKTKGKQGLATEERVIRAIDGTTLTLDEPLELAHPGSGDYRGDVANLSRNLIVESADPAVARGHTMYHRNSSGSISYAEFRHLGKEGVLG